MSDPRKIKNSASMIIDTKLKSTGKIIKFYKNFEAEYLKLQKKEDLEALVKEDLKKISDEPKITLLSTLTSFSYTNKDFLKEFDRGNILVELFLPYCFHIPNHTEFTIYLKEKNIKTFLILEKIWTEKATIPPVFSEDLDYYSENKTLYFNNSTINGPQIPYEPHKGYQPNITGINIEKIDDQNGLFRYSKALIQFDYDDKDIKESEIQKHFKKIKDICLEIVNLFIDNYRLGTDEFYIRRLGDLNVNLIYFISKDVGYYISNFNITSAVMNRSKKEIDEIRINVEKGDRPPLYKLLMMNSKNSIKLSDLTLSLVESYQALEIFLENYLVDEFIKQKYDEQEYINLLDKNWRTKDRLKELIYLLKKVKITEEKDLWENWNFYYKNFRNKVIHRGKEINKNEANEVLSINERIINWILSL